jgi:hypothetical protein
MCYSFGANRLTTVFFSGHRCVYWSEGGGEVGVLGDSHMLAFDLETTGLDPQVDQVTCAAVYDPLAGIERVFLFPVGDDPEAFMVLLDQAERLCSFNGAGFDLQFIAACFQPVEARVAAWRLKLHDVYVACKWGAGISFPLQALLDVNGLPGKTGSGKDAITLFEQGRWEELGAYCLNDTKITHMVSSLDPIVLPKTRFMTMTPHGEFRSSL